MNDPIQAAIDAIRLGIEHTEELQNLHDAYFGKTTRPNLARSIFFEKSIKKMEAALTGLKKFQL